MKVRELIALLEFHGWKLVRQRGSQRQFKKPDSPWVITVPGKLGDDVPLGLLKSIVRKADI